MAVDIRVAPDEKLELVQTYITDTNPNSDYFVISELPDTFSGGKNAFLIAGSDKLLANTEIKIQIRDAAGKVCYVEYSNGLPLEYYEGNSKVVAVYVYPTLTAFGPATITILGQLKDVPQEWNGLYSVKWERQVNINPALANTTRVRLYKRPSVTIKELLQPLYSIVSGSKVASFVTQSFASITVNQLDTFAGDIKRVKVYRTSAGDISDYDLIQDISIESKNLLTTYALSGSVVGNAGLFGPDTLSKVWNTSSLHAVLDSTYVADGLQLTGSGTFTFTSSLSLLSTNTYQLELDTFYTGSTPTNLVAYISGSGSAVYPIATFSGSIPTKNFGTTITSFTIPNDAPTASLYFSQSSGTNQWYIGNISLNLSQDTAFSPNEISFITSMPTILGNDVFNFKFELYDINNNYVPIAVTQSATFTGGNGTIGGTLVLISGSTSASNAAILALSQSVSGTIGIVTGSVSFVSTSVSSSLSQSYGATAAASASLQSSSLYISSSLNSSISASKAAALSSSFGNIQTLANGQFSGSFISNDTIFAPVIGGTTGYISNLFKVGTAPSIYLDARQNPRKIFIGGISDSGSYSNSNTSVYMDSSGKFSLGNQLSFDGTNLTVNGTINITGGNAATQTYASGTAFTQATTAQSNAVSTAASDATTKANSARTAAELFASGIGTNAVASGSAAATAAQTAAINQAKADASASVTLLANGNWTAGSGTFITSNSISSPVIAGNAGYISSLFKVGQGGITLDGGNKKIFIGTGTFGNANTGFYADNDGNFSLGNQLTFTGGNLAIAGAASIGGTTATTIANGAAAGASALQSGANITSLTNNAGYQDAGNVNNAAKTAGSVGGWTINSTNLTSNNNRTILYNTGYIELKDSAGQNKITIDSSATLPSPTAGSDSGNIVIPAQAAQTSYYQNGAATGGNTAVGYYAPNNSYSLQWSQEVIFTPTISGYYEFTTWFPKNSALGANGSSSTAIMGLRAYIYNMAGQSLINDDGKEYIEGPVEGAAANVIVGAFSAGTYGNQYNRDGTGAYFSNQYLTAGVAVRFLIQWIVFNIAYYDTLTINAYWPATNVQFISNVPKTNINQQGFQVIQDTNRYLTIRPSGWYMYNDPAIYGGSPPTYLADQGVTEVTGIMGGTLVVLNATDKGDWHSGKQKQYIRSAQYSFANRAAGGNFITSFFYGGYGRSFNLTRAYGWFTPNSSTGFTAYDGQWWPYAYNIESITRIGYGKFHVTFAESIMDTYGAYSGGGIYTVFIGRGAGDYAADFQTAALSNIHHTGFDMDLGSETPANRFVSILVIA
jgi:hypothetical protein